MINPTPGAAIPLFAGERSTGKAEVNCFTRSFQKIHIDFILNKYWNVEIKGKK